LPCISLAVGRALGLAALIFLPGTARAQDTPEYRIESAAQEITQLYWLADTAAVCGWGERGRLREVQTVFIAISRCPPDRTEQARLGHHGISSQL